MKFISLNQYRDITRQFGISNSRGHIGSIVLIRAHVKQIVKFGTRPLEKEFFNREGIITYASSYATSPEIGYKVTFPDGNNTGVRSRAWFLLEDFTIIACPSTAIRTLEARNKIKQAVPEAVPKVTTEVETEPYPFKTEPNEVPYATKIYTPSIPSGFTGPYVAPLKDTPKGSLVLDKSPNLPTQWVVPSLFTDKDALRVVILPSVQYVSLTLRQAELQLSSNLVKVSIVS